MGAHALWLLLVVLWVAKPAHGTQATFPDGTQDQLPKRIWADRKSRGQLPVWLQKQQQSNNICSARTRVKVSSCVAKIFGEDARQGDFYQFGVYTGHSMRYTIHRLRKLHDLHVRKAWGFDSFQGLPDVDDQNEKKDNFWVGGTFSVADKLGIYSLSNLTRALSKTIDPGNTSLAFIPGFFNTSLTPTLHEEQRMAPAVYVDGDADLYSSTHQFLDWLFASKLIQSGTLIYFDEFPMGEHRAFHEVLRKYNVTAVHVYGSFRKLFCIVSWRDNPRPDSLRNCSCTPQSRPYVPTRPRPRWTEHDDKPLCTD
mmetsp:Transcript_83016/g.146417  ORF Transcript_83016/g.146417 Transcript_83016/m.146417 type:complete len:311 (-) Transcript_83016:30-962(-)